MLIMHERDMEDLQDTIKGCRLVGQQFVFFPINDTSVNSVNGGSHWSLLIYCGRDKVFYYLDSIPGSSNKVFASQLVKQLAPFLNAPQGEQESSTSGSDGGRGGKTKKHAKGQQTGSSVVMKEVKCTRQANAFDCGMHTVCHAEALVQLLAEQPNLLLSDPAVVAALNKKMSAVAVTERRKTLKEELLQFEHKD